MLLKPSSIKDDINHDKRFYDELLYIMGLKEKKVEERKVLERCAEGRRNSSSLLENTITQLHHGGKVDMLEKPDRFGNLYEERLFNVASKLAVTWVVRVLFLKFLEAWLLSCHQGDRAYIFLKLDKVKDYKDLNKLFFHVLSRRPDEREEDIKRVFRNVPYLNPSLFQPTDLERQTIFISDLTSDTSLPLYQSTVLKLDQGGKPAEHLGALEYLFGFLDAYDFGFTGSQGRKKAQVDPSVMDKIFGEIKGLGDESFSGSITTDTYRETVRAGVVQKFNEEKGWRCRDLDSLNIKIEDRMEANEIIKNLEIGDHRVISSGHFLVSALNELMVIKNELKILQDRNGRWLKGYDMQVVKGVLVVTNGKGELFAYHPDDPESQRIQEALFHEKKALVQDCLLGVHVDADAVMICRLRLWLELLKSAYYKQPDDRLTNFSPVCYAGLPDLRSEYLLGKELAPLPDIDIKAGH